MQTPNAAHAVRFRVDFTESSGLLTKLLSDLEAAGAEVDTVERVRVGPGHMVRDVFVFAADESHMASLTERVRDMCGDGLREVEDQTTQLHVGGKIETKLKMPVRGRDDLSTVYTPGVARVCNAIAQDPARAHELTIKANTVAIVSDGSAVLGLGDIGPYAAMPVMEGKAMLFKEFGGLNAFPLCLHSGSPERIVDAVCELEPAFGGINLEDIAAPHCFWIEEQLQERLDIPVFHDDQHGTAVAVYAALRNAVKVTERRMQDLCVVLSGAGAAGIAIVKILKGAGVGDIVVADRRGAIYPGREGLDETKGWLADNTNLERVKGGLAESLAGADVFVGVSGPNLLERSDVLSMAPKPIVFALANPVPEIAPEALEGMAGVVATGRSDYPNQINNVLCFPGIFRGALDAGATRITEGMKLAAAEAIAQRIPEGELTPDCIVPSVFDRQVAPQVAAAVAAAARAEGVVRTDA